jgi:hypothetical protein
MNARLLAAAVALSACSDSRRTPSPDVDAAPTDPDAGLPDAAVDAGPPDAEVAPAPEILDPGVISSSDATSSEHEPTAAVSSDGRAAVAFIGRGTDAYVIGYRVSLDGGRTWADIGVLDPPAGFSAGDPWLAADAAGALYLAWGAVRRNLAGERVEMHLYISRSGPGSTTFDPGVEVTDPDTPAFYDQDRIAFTPSGLFLYTYMRYFDATLEETQIVAATSSDGESWTTTMVASGIHFKNMALVCTSTGTDRVWLRYPDYGYGVVVRSSEDDGESWPDEDLHVVQEPGEDAAVVPTPGGCVVDGDHVWVLYGLSDGQSEVMTRVRVAHSEDGGRSFSERLDVPREEGRDLFLFPSMTRDPAGVLHVAYYAGGAIGDESASYRWTQTAEDGAFGPSVEVRSPVRFDPDRAYAGWLGDYMSLGWAEGVVMAFTDNGSGTAHTAFYREIVRD